MAKAQTIGLSGAGDADAVGGSERALIEAAQQGDPDAFEQLVRLYDRSVMRVTLNVLRSPEDARDAYQEAFLKAYRKLDTFRFQCSFHTWIYRIATNVCLDQLRRKNVRKEQTVDDRDDEIGSNPLRNAAERRPAGDPGRAYEAGDLGKKINDALEQLSPNERMVFELRHYEGLRLRKIGEIVGISEEAAKNSLFRATRKMRAELGEFQGA